MIAWLNSLFPPLPKWHLALLFIVALLMALVSYIFLIHGETALISVLPGLVLLLLVWRPVPMRTGDRVQWWLAVICLTYILGYPVYIVLISPLL
jgi:hypothetical protein